MAKLKERQKKRMKGFEAIYVSSKVSRPRRKRLSFKMTIQRIFTKSYRFNQQLLNKAPGAK
jgi:hypothetical protein